MLPVLAIIVGAGAFLLGTSFPVKWLRRIARWSMANLYPLNCQELHEVRRLPRAVAVRGVTAPGPVGLLTSPLSGTHCVWYRVCVWAAGATTESPDMRSYEARTAMGLDDGTGRVLVVPSLVDAHNLGAPADLVEDRPVPDDLRPVLRRLAGEATVPGDVRRLLRRRGPMWAEETVVREGRPVLVIGAPRRSGGVVTIRQRALGWSGITCESLASLVDRLAEHAEDYLWQLRVMLSLVGIFLAASGTVDIGR